jgi:hypothetical protein
VNARHANALIAAAAGPVLPAIGESRFMLLLFGWVAARLQHNVCQIVGNPVCKAVCRCGDQTGVKPALPWVRFDNIMAICA